MLIILFVLNKCHLFQTNGFYFRESITWTEKQAICMFGSLVKREMSMLPILFMCPLSTVVYGKHFVRGHFQYFSWLESTNIR